MKLTTVNDEDNISVKDLKTGDKVTSDAGVRSPITVEVQSEEDVGQLPQVKEPPFDV